MSEVNRRDFLNGVLAALASRALASQPTPAWSAGTAVMDITPDTSLWMAGFARRTQPSQGVSLPLFAKAIALQSGREPAAVLVTVDLLGLTARMTDRVAAQIQRRHRIRRANLSFNASHTHCGPVVDEQLSVAYDLSSEQWSAIRAYTASLEDKLVGLIEAALTRLRPARLAYARGEAGFAANRRVAFKPNGPVDHSVPVLRVDDADGTLRAIVFGYACHNTTLPAAFVQYHGDYAGVAQARLQEHHPGATAMFVAGCGADANPSPRGTLELVQAHGAALADAVDRALPAAAPLGAGLRTGYSVVELPFVDEGARERWRKQLDVEDVYLQRYAALMKAIRDREGRLPSAQPAPVQVWRLGVRSAGRPATVSDAGELTLVAIGGEVVVDYALRLSREYADRPIWAAGYSNDVFGYLPSARVRREGGYEGADAMIYYGRPGPFTERVEELIVGEVRRLMRRTGSS